MKNSPTTTTVTMAVNRVAMPTTADIARSPLMVTVDATRHQMFHLMRRVTRSTAVHDRHENLMQPPDRPVESIGAVNSEPRRCNGDRGAVSLEQVLWFVASGVSVAVVAGILWSRIREQANSPIQAPIAPWWGLRHRWCGPMAVVGAPGCAPAHPAAHQSVTSI